MFHFARSSGWGLSFFISRSRYISIGRRIANGFLPCFFFRFISFLFPEHRISMTDGRKNEIRRPQEILHLHVCCDLES